MSHRFLRNTNPGGVPHKMCKQLYEHRDHLWSFLRDPQVTPTNNHAEQSLRPGVIWRNLSFGTQSECGDRFVEIMLTVIKTSRQQDRSVVQYLSQAIQNQVSESLLARS